MDFQLRLVSPNFGSRLTDTVIQLDHLRKHRLGGTTAPWIFFQLKDIFHMLESIGSARIEGNRTTISEYIEQKIENKERASEQFAEIANVEDAMQFIEESITEGSEITHQFVRELHQLVVRGLEQEGDKTPGAYRTWNVEIAASSHVPPESVRVQSCMDEFIAFINAADPDKYDLIKIALAHHRFTWIHPFGNGNGRVVRLLTYALLIKFGFNVKNGQLINPTAVFCNDRDLYYEKLAMADSGTDDALLGWCDYVLHGILLEVSKVDKLTNYEYLSAHILQPALKLAVDRRYVTAEEAKVLTVGITEQQFRSGDLEKMLPDTSSRQRTHLIGKMKDAGFIRPLKEQGRTYTVNFINNFLMRCLMQRLEAEEFIPPINQR